MPTAVFYITIGFFIFIMLIIAFGLWFLTRLFDRGGRSGREQEEETRLMQDLHQGLERMAARLEALETLLIDAKAKEKNDGE